MNGIMAPPDDNNSRPEKRTLFLHLRIKVVLHHVSENGSQVPGLTDRLARGEELIPY